MEGLEDLIVDVSEADGASVDPPIAGDANVAAAAASVEAKKKSKKAQTWRG